VFWLRGSHELRPALHHTAGEGGFKARRLQLPALALVVQQGSTQGGFVGLPAQAKISEEVSRYPQTIPTEEGAEMAKVPHIGLEHVAFAFGVLYTANYLSVWMWSYPFVYCLASPVATAFYIAFGTAALYFVALMIAISLFAKSKWGLLKWCIIGIAVIEVPMFCVYLFKLGASCG